MKEYILCAAIWYKTQPTSFFLPLNIKEGVVVAGRRHNDCIAIFVTLSGKRSVLSECGEYEQGFITSANRFVDRFTAAEIAHKANQLKDGNPTNELYSEDLY